VTASRKVSYWIVPLGLLGGIVAVACSRPAPQPASAITRVALRPAWPPKPDDPPAEVQEFLYRVLQNVPAGGTGVTGYQFHHWKQEGKPTDEAIGLKAIPGVAPDAFIASVMDVDGYKGQIAHVEACRSVPDPAYKPPDKVRFFQVISVPGVARVQQELVLVDAGTIQGYRVAYWYLLADRTRSLDPKFAARSDFNIGVWVAAPGAVGYALSSWPRRDDVNRLQWVSLTSGANALAKKVVEGNIDGMAEWAKKQGKAAPPSK
jgi:hypothetical protein